MTTRTILLADDHIAWRDLLRNSLNDIKGLTVQDCTDSRQDTLDAIVRHPPSLLILDVELCDGCSVNLCQELDEIGVATRTLFLTAYDEDGYMARALHGKATGYLLKTAPLVMILEAIQQAAHGKILWTEYQLLRVQHWQKIAWTKWETLTPREQKIVTGLADFKTDAEIAGELQISLRTVNNYLTHILDKLSMENRREVARWAVRHKLVNGWWMG